jgi:NADH-quinone oxidoreductase subunit C
MCGLHHPENPAESEFGLMYQLHNMPKNWRIRIKTFMSRENSGYANRYGYLENSWLDGKTGI